MNQNQIKLLFDGECPICRNEAAWLAARDQQKRLVLEDITASDFDPARYGVTMTELMGSLHGVLPDGRLTRGMETFRQAYGAVGLGWLAAPTGWPGLRTIFDFLYRLFARHRIRLGRLVGRTCSTDRCSIK